MIHFDKFDKFEKHATVEKTLANVTTTATGWEGYMRCEMCERGKRCESNPKVELNIGDGTRFVGEGTIRKECTKQKSTLNYKPMGH